VATVKRASRAIADLRDHVTPIPGVATVKRASQATARLRDLFTPTPGVTVVQRASLAVATLGEHFTASRRWVAVIVTATAYFAGVVGYLQANSTGVNQLVAALTSGNPGRTAAALGSARYGVPDVLAYAGETGLLSGLAPSSGILLVVGALVLPPVLAGAVTGLREETTWRPSWLHVIGGVGPLVSVGLVFFAGNSAEVRVAALPLLVDLLVLVGFPAAVVTSFLLNRLVVVFPLRRLENVGNE
jgi:hypothetical protein